MLGEDGGGARGGLGRETCIVILFRKNYISFT